MSGWCATVNINPLVCLADVCHRSIACIYGGLEEAAFAVAAQFQLLLKAALVGRLLRTLLGGEQCVSEGTASVASEARGMGEQRGSDSGLPS